MTLEDIKKYEKVIRWVIIIFIIGVFAYSIGNTARANKYRGLCDKYREQFTAAEERNRALNDRLSRITEVVGRLSETTERNVTDARSIIETVELLRVQIQDLENICYGDGTIDSYYDWLDSELGLQ